MAEYSACVIYGITIDRETAEIIGFAAPYILDGTNYHIFEEWCCGETLYLGYKLAEIDLNNHDHVDFYPDVHREMEFYEWAKRAFLNPSINPKYYVINQSFF